MPPTVTAGSSSPREETACSSAPVSGRCRSGIVSTRGGGPRTIASRIVSMADEPRDRRRDGRRCYLHHGLEDVLISDPATLDAGTARRIVRGVLDSGRGPRPVPRHQPGGPRRLVQILTRFWVGARVDEGRPYVIAFISNECVFLRP